MYAKMGWRGKQAFHTHTHTHQAKKEREKARERERERGGVSRLLT